MDFGWRFAFGHPFETDKDFDHATDTFRISPKRLRDGPAAEAFDDRSWREVDCRTIGPSNCPSTPRESQPRYKAIGRNFPQTSVGWYRKKFLVPKSDFGRRISVEFDGIHRDAVVWVNGFYLGRESNGYIGCRYDVTDYLNYGGENTVAVRVDATLEKAGSTKAPGSTACLAGKNRSVCTSNKTGSASSPRWRRFGGDRRRNVDRQRGKSDRVFTVGTRSWTTRARPSRRPLEKVSLGPVRR